MEGISEGVGQELAVIENPMNIQNDLEAQQVGEDKEDSEEEKPYCSHNNSIWSG